MLSIKTIAIILWGFCLLFDLLRVLYFFQRLKSKIQCKKVIYFFFDFAFWWLMFYVNLVKSPMLKVCCICSSPSSASPHFGSISCLACAAFFRRTVSLSIEFQCSENNSCKVYYGIDYSNFVFLLIYFKLFKSKELFVKHAATIDVLLLEWNQNVRVL